MKKFSAIAIVFIIIGALLLCGVKSNTNQAYLRIHIRANSNLTIDQNVKYIVKESLVGYLTPLLIEAVTFEKAKQIIKQNISNIEDVANMVLRNNGFSYLANAQVNDEYFPTRSYESYTLESGIYDALIVNLGEGEGDNWWCVVYPPLCFSSSGQNNIIYKSILMEIIENWKKSN